MCGCSITVNCVVRKKNNKQKTKLQDSVAVTAKESWKITNYKVLGRIMLVLFRSRATLNDKVTYFYGGHQF
jgi:hypothetical protein